MGFRPRPQRNMQLVVRTLCEGRIGLNRTAWEEMHYLGPAIDRATYATPESAGNSKTGNGLLALPARVAVAGSLPRFPRSALTLSFATLGAESNGQPATAGGIYGNVNGLLNTSSGSEDMSCRASGQWVGRGHKGLCIAVFPSCQVPYGLGLPIHAVDA